MFRAAAELCRGGAVVGLLYSSSRAFVQCGVAGGAMAVFLVVPV